MSLVTPKRLRETYAYLRGCKPFAGWKLPEAETLKFEVLEGRDHAQYDPNQRRHLIKVNAMTHLTLEQLFASMAHEMVHLHQDLLGRLPCQKDPHNGDFRRWAKSVCHHLGFDVQKF